MKEEYNLKLGVDQIILLEDLLAAHEQKLLDRWDRGIDARDNNINNLNNLRRIKESILEEKGYFADDDYKEKTIGFKPYPLPKDEKEESKKEEDVKEIDITDIYTQLTEEELQQAIEIAYEVMKEKFPKDNEQSEDLVRSLTKTIKNFTDEEVVALVKSLLEDERTKTILYENLGILKLNLNDVLYDRESKIPDPEINEEQGLEKEPLLNKNIKLEGWDE